MEGKKLQRGRCDAHPGKDATKHLLDSGAATVTSHLGGQGNGFGIIMFLMVPL
jgi:basic membrane lipoprotein Med (substrate-binding protein (PBP1-ABC) superfamily)